VYITRQRQYQLTASKTWNDEYALTKDINIPKKRIDVPNRDRTKPMARLLKFPVVSAFSTLILGICA